MNCDRCGKQLTCPHCMRIKEQSGEAVKFLKAILKDSSGIESVEIFKEARKAVIARHEVIQAKNLLGLKVTRGKDDTWVWALPEPTIPRAKRCDLCNQTIEGKPVMAGSITLCSQRCFERL